MSSQIGFINKFTNKYKLILSAFVLFLFYFYFGSFVIDTDFGWHLRFGQIILNTQSIPKHDLFSYTMPSYLFVDHEWLTDLIMALLYNIGGIILLSFSYSLVVVCAFLLQIKTISRKWFTLLFVLSELAIAQLFGLRPQLISVFLFSLVLVSIFDKKIFERFKYLIPLLFLIWANMHGAFIMGIMILSISMFSEMVEERKINIRNLIILSLSVLSTFLNPYGINLWKEIVVSLMDVSLRWELVEWAPTFLFFNFPMIVICVISSVFFIRYFKKFDLKEKLLYILLFFIGLSSARNFVFLLFIAIIIVGKGLDLLALELKKYKYGTKRLEKLYLVLGALFFLLSALPVAQSFVYLIKTYPYGKQYVYSSSQGLSAYPLTAVNFINSHPSKGNIFSVYELGGYLDWHLPEKKVFIDGRMPSWKLSKINNNESRNAFLEYEEILYGETPLDSKIKKYNIDTFLLPVSKNSNQKPDSKISNSLLFLVKPVWGFQPYKIELLISRLIQNGFIKTYQDESSQIFRKL